MKRTVTIMAGVVTLGLALYVGSRLTAQTGTPTDAGAAPAPTTRVRMVNLQYVLKNYKRMDMLRSETTELLGQYEEQLKKLKVELEGRTRQLQDPKFADQKGAIEHEVKRLQRAMEDKQAEARVTLDKKQGEVIVLIYKELDEAVRTYSRQAGIELVLHYADTIVESEKFNPNNVARKMTQGACMPMYMLPSLDISQDIVNALNAKFAVNTAAPAGTGSH